MAGKDYDAILGIQTDSTQDDIKASYHKLAKEYHPDHCKEDHHSTFQAIQKAYSVLNSPIQRRIYNNHLQDRGTATYLPHCGDC